MSITGQVAEEDAPFKAFLRRQLTAFYTTHAPEQLQQIAVLVNYYSTVGSEDELNHRLRRKYGADLRNMDVALPAWWDAVQSGANENRWMLEAEAVAEAAEGGEKAERGSRGQGGGRGW